MSAFQWVKNLFTKKQTRADGTKSKTKGIDKKETIKKRQDELVIENITAQFFFLQGSGSGKYDCLDTYGLYDKHSDVFSFYAVFDGHGTSGKEASNSACDFMLSYIDKHHEAIMKADEDEAIFSLLQSMFAKADDSLRTVGVDMDLSGTTCVCVLAKGTALYVANVGDSRAVLGRVSPLHRFAVELTQDHKPFVKRERDRILKAGGFIRKIVNPEGAVGPFRVWADEDGPGLGLTRCLGNFGSKKIGVTCTPDIQKLNLKEVDQFVVIATDGLWEVMSSTEVVAFIVRLGDDRSLAAKQLVVEARNIWYELNRIKKTEAKISDTPEIRYGIDDISAILVFISYEGVPAVYSSRGPQSPADLANSRPLRGEAGDQVSGEDRLLRRATRRASEGHPPDSRDTGQPRPDAETQAEHRHEHKPEQHSPRADAFGYLIPDSVAGQPTGMAENDYRKVFHNAEQLAVMEKVPEAPANQLAMGVAYLDSGLLRDNMRAPDRLIKDEYENDFDVEADDDFIPEGVRNFQDLHSTGGFRGLAQTFGHADGTQGLASSRAGRGADKNRPRGKSRADSIDLLGDP
jgi:integrin-linked kinase-associated serine/threonine phosphatase 2C